MTGLVKGFLKKTEEKKLYVSAAQIRKEGQVIDEWTRFPGKPRFEAYSISKTFAAAGVGIAIKENLITLDDRIVDSFPEESYDLTNENALKITVRDLLTMTSGVSERMLRRAGYERNHEQDWVRYFFKHAPFLNEPGTTFLYNNANAYILGCLIEKKSGQNLREYLRYRLFEPLEIHNVEWTSCPMGHTIAANALQLSVDEVGNFGQLLLNKGVYKGKRILPEAFIDDMLVPHYESTEFVPNDPPVKAGYGYQIWIDEANDLVFMWGILGQYCILIPKKNVVISVLSLEPTDEMRHELYPLSPLRQIIWEELVMKV